MDYQSIIDYYYGVETTALRQILITHSCAVAEKALQVCRRHPELGLDSEFVEAAAMLHDIGIIQCDAPGIHCYGTRPYIQHGLAGEEMLLSLSSQGVKGVKDDSLAPEISIGGSNVFNTFDPMKSFNFQKTFNSLSSLKSLKNIANVCSHHTGAGITREEIVAQGLDLPVADYLPETLEEKLICYADKFFSKSRLTEEKPLDQVERSLRKFGEAGLMRFREWHQLFG